MQHDPLDAAAHVEPHMNYKNVLYHSPPHSFHKTVQPGRAADPTGKRGARVSRETSALQFQCSSAANPDILRTTESSWLRPAQHLCERDNNDTSKKVNNPHRILEPIDQHPVEQPPNKLPITLTTYSSNHLLTR